MNHLVSKGVKMENKFIVFYMDEEGLSSLDYSVRDHGFIHGYYETLQAIENNQQKIYTTQLSLLHANLFEKGYRIFVREKNDDMFEIKLGYENDRTNREIKVFHNLEKMLIAGEFNI